jgi:sucrose-6-phosphate hydrolase SacC (GH32 family)
MKPTALILCAVFFCGLALTGAKAQELYNETYRPQFHFTAREGWLNDPNGLVFYDSDYHLFFQHNPFGTKWGNMTWGHAVSRDLVHWHQLPNALEPDDLGTIYSGSAVVDWNNTAGFQSGSEKTLVAIYTAAGEHAPEKKPYTQCLSYSNDRGRTWTKYSGNPVLPNIYESNRDPKVFWHEATKRWVMALYVDVPDGDKKDAQGRQAVIQTIQFFNSPDLKSWTYLSRVDGFFECPDIFELPLDGNTRDTRWVLFAADGDYLTGRFDGKAFIKESGKHRGDYGKNFYAAQTYSDIPSSDGRRILIGWMKDGEYPAMTFNQQMTFPVELTLRKTAEGIRLFKWPAREISSLYNGMREWKKTSVKPGENPLEKLSGELFDIEAEIEAGKATEFGLLIRGHKISYAVKEGKLTAFDRSAELRPVSNRVKLRLLVDRTSVEIFGNDGQVTMSSCFLPSPDDRSLAFYAIGGAAKINLLRVTELKPAWPGRT